MNRYCLRALHKSPWNCGKMPKKTAKSKAKVETPSSVNNNPVYLNNKGVLCLRILAKPGAKINSIQGLSPEGVGVQIAAPPVDGDANVELLKYISKLLGIRKSDITLERGSRSRNKLLEVTSNELSVGDVTKLLELEMTKE